MGGRGGGGELANLDHTYLYFLYVYIYMLYLCI